MIATGAHRWLVAKDGATARCPACGAVVRAVLAVDSLGLRSYFRITTPVDEVSRDVSIVARDCDARLAL